MRTIPESSPPAGAKSETCALAMGDQASSARLRRSFGSNPLITCGLSTFNNSCNIWPSFALRLLSRRRHLAPFPLDANRRVLDNFPLRKNILSVFFCTKLRASPNTPEQGRVKSHGNGRQNAIGSRLRIGNSRSDKRSPRHQRETETISGERPPGRFDLRTFDSLSNISTNGALLRRFLGRLGGLGS